MTQVDDDLETQYGASTGEDGLSVLSQLKARREEIVRAQILPLAVPRWDDPKIVVKYKPVDHTLLRNANAKVENAPAKDKARVELEVNCDVLIRACDSVVAVLDDHEYSLRPGDPHGEPTMFDADLADNLGLDEKLGRRATAREIVKALYITDGDILAAASALSEFSGYRNQEADEGLAGES